MDHMSDEFHNGMKNMESIITSGAQKDISKQIAIMSDEIKQERNIAACFIFEILLIFVIMHIFYDTKLSFQKVLFLLDLPFWEVSCYPWRFLSL